MLSRSQLQWLHSKPRLYGVLRPGRWLYCVCEEAEGWLDDMLCSWARQLLGIAPWRNGIAARWELGWLLSGMARAVRDVAKRRARIWALQDNDFYKTAFLHELACDGAWACRSGVLLRK